MPNLPEGSIEQILEALHERAKELNCLYRVDEILSQTSKSAEEVCGELVEALPSGWQYPDNCHARMTLGEFMCHSPSYQESPWCLAADILVEGVRVGEIAVCYTERKPEEDEGPFLREERRLINAVAERVALFIMQRRLRHAHDSWESARQTIAAHPTHSWPVLIHFLRRTDPTLLARITRKMVNHLRWNGVREADALLPEHLPEDHPMNQWGTEENRPIQKQALQSITGLTDKAFKVAARHLSEDEIVSCIHMWITEEKSSFLIRVLESPDATLTKIAGAVERFQNLEIDENDLPQSVQMSLKVALLRRFFSDDLDYINIAKNHVSICDFFELVQRLIYTPDSRGKLGGKGAGLFLATHIIRKSKEHDELFTSLRIPKTWYIPSDALLEFVSYNNLDEVYNIKYSDIERIRQEYPRIVQVFKNSKFPPEITKGLASALDDFEDRPIIVRSSSLLEDQAGAAFSGKYKSLFIANQGSKKERLEALEDAIAEVYASVLGPDPIEYRAERGLLDFHEEMGILIQEVVGAKIGDYFLPSFSGVAFSNNEFRWSARIKREDGLVRIVPGLGTRAVDRLSDDYPVLIAPGQPNLRVNVTADEVCRYSPKYADVINLGRNAFESTEVETILRQFGDEYPLARSIVSVVDGDRVRPPTGLEPDWENDDFVVTFEGLVSKTSFVNQIRGLLQILRRELGTPVDIEFACEGNQFYLVQCRSQSGSLTDMPAPIPRDLPRSRVLFTADRYVSNGWVPDITHIVYVDPDAYAEVTELQALKDVGRAVGRLNSILPKRQFILMGPGRWGSRGDIKLGVSVTYSDINNTAVMMEIARKRGHYVPELSFGTHFFQDLVEAGIRYLPLYPDEPGIIFRERFFHRARNIFPELVPEFANLSSVIKVIDVPRETDGRVLRVLMNADLDQAVGLFTKASTALNLEQHADWAVEASPEDHWRWRLRMAENIASHLDPERFGVEGVFVIGSTKNATAGPGSDIDLLVHFTGNGAQRHELELWFEGWSQALAEVNYLRTGYRSTGGLLDIHYVTDEEIRNRTSFAVKIGAVTDAARPLAMKHDVHMPDPEDSEAGPLDDEDERAAVVEEG